MKRFVLFAIPTYSRTCSMEFAQSIGDMACKLSDMKIPHALFFLGGICFVDQARNICISKFLEGLKGAPEFTDLFFLDDDVGFPGKAVIDLLERPEPIVFGAYPKKTDEVAFPVVMKLGEGDKIIEKDGLVLADTCPAGFLRIKREVIEALVKEEGTYIYVDQDDNVLNVPNVFETGPKNGMYFGEDVVFAVKAQKAGFDLWCKPDIAFSHRGSKVWRNTLEPSLVPHRN